MSNPPVDLAYFLAAQKQILEAVMNRDPVEIDLDREQRREEEEIIHARAGALHDEVMSEFMNSPADIIEALGEQSDDFIKTLIKHPDIAFACGDYFEESVQKTALKRARGEK